MSIATEITRIETARNKLRAKAVGLGIGTGTDKLDVIANEFDAIENKGAVSAQVKEGETYTIPRGYHNGSGTVSGAAGGGNYTLQSKTATPTKSQQNVTPDSGYYGLSDVTVKPIPDNYQDVSSVNATAADVLANKIIVTADGTVTPGTMQNNGAVNQTLDATTGKQSYTVPKGFHSGTGTVKIALEEKSATPTKSSQDITPTAGKVLSKVSVAPIPDEYQDVSGVTTVAGNVLEGDIFVDADGNLVEGTMKDNGAVNVTLNTTTTSYTVAAGKHSGTGKVSIVLETKIATPTESGQEITPTAGKVLSKVTVAAIPDNYVDKTGAEAIDMTIDGLTQTSVTIPEGYTLGGTVALTDDIEDALAAI